MHRQVLMPRGAGPLLDDASGSRRASLPVFRPGPGSAPKLRSWASPQAALELGEAGKLARPTTLSHSGTASASVGTRLITGPKNADSAGAGTG